MKIKPEHYKYLSDAITAVLDRNPTAVARYERGDFPRATAVKDLQKRFCFDLLAAAQISMWVCDELYPYCDDSHIYTALRRICPTVCAEPGRQRTL